MKKYFLFAVVAALLTGCSSEEATTKETTSEQSPVAFDIYTPRSVSRAGVPNDITDTNIKDGTSKAALAGFGVFGYYTAGETYDDKAKPNFMYNQQVTYSSSKWSYEPVKYWPNEYGNAAVSDEIDYVTFFAYAPWTKMVPSTGLPDVTGMSDADAKHAQNYNITSISKNSATGDPIIKYVVDTDPATSVDLLWGVAADNTSSYYSPIAGTVTVTDGLPFINLVKPKVPATDKLLFNLRHALAKVKVTIKYVADAATPSGSSATINDYTRIFVRSLTMSGFAVKGALNLNNTKAKEPLWLGYDGQTDIIFNDVTFHDGRKDGKEGTTNGDQNNESPQGLNPKITENYAATIAATTTTLQKFDANNKNPGVTKDEQLVFGGTGSANDGYFYIIPRNDSGSGVDITLVYDVETIDDNLAGLLSDGVTHGTSIENVITKRDIFGSNTDFKPGYQYTINIIVGMTSVKIDANVVAWDTSTGAAQPQLPANQ